MNNKFFKTAITILILTSLVICISPAAAAEVYVSHHISSNVTFEMSDIPSATEQIVFDTLSSLLPNPVVVCAIMGNMYRESGMRTWIYEGDWSLKDCESRKFTDKINKSLENPTEETEDYFEKWVPFPGFEGFGLVQLTCHSFKETLYRRAVIEHRRIDDPVLQCEDLVYWLTGYYYDTLYKEIENTEDLWLATYKFASIYERCVVSEISYEIRLQAAEHYWYMFVEPEDT